MIDGSVCKSISEYTPLLDFRMAFSEAFGVSLQFPSTNTSYCSASDTTCATNGTLCIGENGCVRIDLCEDTGRFRAAAYDSECRFAGDRGRPVLTNNAAGLLDLVLLVGFFAWWFRDKAHPPGAGRFEPMRVAWRHMLDRAPALHLDLFGWRRYQQQLRAKEDAMLKWW
jgi:hypothetical protein